MMWKYLAVPLVGAVIGYITNWIAVKMLFFPHYEKRLFGIRLPFTPGVIPKGKPRLAKAAGEVIEKQLLNEEVMRETLLSEEIKQKMFQTVEEWTNERKASDLTLRQAVLHVVDQDSLNDIIAQTEEDISDYLRTKISEKDPAKLLAEIIVEEAKSRLADSMVGMFLSGSFMDKLAEEIENKVQEYLDTELYPMIDMEVQKESLNLQNKQCRDLIYSLEGWDFSLPEMIWELYEKAVQNHLVDILDTLDFSTIVQNKINSMQVEELEEIVLHIMKKELSAVVNIGALIGLLLGLANILIMRI